MKSPITRPSSFSIGASTIRPVSGSRPASIRSSQASAPGPLTAYCAKPEMSRMPTAARTARTSAATWGKSVERRHENASRTPGGANQSGTSRPQAAPNSAPSAARRSWIGEVRSCRPAGSSSFGKRMEKRRA